MPAVPGSLSWFAGCGTECIAINAPKTRRNRTRLAPLAAILAAVGGKIEWTEAPRGGASYSKNIGDEPLAAPGIRLERGAVFVA